MRKRKVCESKQPGSIWPQSDASKFRFHSKINKKESTNSFTSAAAETNNKLGVFTSEVN